MILMKIDNLDRMELLLIKKSQVYRDRYNKDPSIIFFDFPPAVDQKKVSAATALMEDAKSGHLETSFGGKDQELQISNINVGGLSNTAPDLSGLSLDRWRIWRLGGPDFNKLIWTTYGKHIIQGFDGSNKIINWNICLKSINPAHVVRLAAFSDLNLDQSWFDQPSLSNQVGNDGTFGFSHQYTSRISSTISQTPNAVRLLVTDYLLKNAYKV